MHELLGRTGYIFLFYSVIACFPMFSFFFFNAKHRKSWLCKCYHYLVGKPIFNLTQWHALVNVRFILSHSSACSYPIISVYVELKRFVEEIFNSLFECFCLFIICQKRRLFELTIWNITSKMCYSRQNNFKIIYLVPRILIYMNHIWKLA